MDKKVSEDRRLKLEVEIHPSPAQDENQAGCGIEGNGIRVLTCEPTPVEQGHDFATSTGILDREELSELSDISIENPAVGGSPTDNNMMYGVTDKSATSSSFSERERGRTFWENIFFLYQGNGNWR